MLFSINEQWVNVLGWSLPSYPTLIGFAIFSSTLLFVWLGRQNGMGFCVDCALAGLILGLIFARADHVLLHWNYFSDAASEITDLKAGGLGWVGALMGGILGVWLMATLRRKNGRLMLEAAALVVPLVMFGGWWACLTNDCAYGAEVTNLADYPSAWVWEAAGDYGTLAPRWRTQGIGMGVSAVIFTIIALLIWRDWAKGWRLPLAVLLSVCAMIFISVLRGDLP